MCYHIIVSDNYEVKLFEKETFYMAEGQKTSPEKKIKKIFLDETFLKKETSNRAEGQKTSPEKKIKKILLR